MPSSMSLSLSSSSSPIPSARRRLRRRGGVVRRRRSLPLLAALSLVVSFVVLLISNNNNHGVSNIVGVAGAPTANANANANAAAKSGSGSASDVDIAFQKKIRKPVYSLNSKNFDSSLRDGNAWLIEFYAPWCGHCTRFAATYEQVANQLHSRHTKPGETRLVNVAKVDGAAERAVSSRFGVHGFPTFFLVDGWTVREYDGARSLDGLVKFATKGYVDVEPVPFLFGPFGPMGQTRSLLMRSGTWAVGLYENLTTERKMKPLMAMAVLCVGGLVTGLVSILVVGLVFLPKAKQD